MTTGKYELTVGPHTWSSYASSSDLSATQAQGTTCSCGVNALDWQEQHASRLGMFGRKFWEQQLPFYWLKQKVVPLESGSDINTGGNGVKLLPGGAELEGLLLETELHSGSADKVLYRAPFKHQDHVLYLFLCMLIFASAYPCGCRFLYGDLLHISFC